MLKKVLIAITLLVSCILTALETPYIDEKPTYQCQSNDFYGAYWNPMPDIILERIIGKSWKTDCPVSLDDLAYVQVTHYNDDGKLVTGELIYHKTLAIEIIEIFQDLYEGDFPVHKMVLIDDYNADDDLSMEDNNSSAFCSRSITGRPGVFSKHSYGTTIDINPKVNPYVKGDTVLPSGSAKYIDRSLDEPGMICPGNVCYQAFISRGYTWGGHWTSLKDYQHFEKDLD